MEKKRKEVKTAVALGYDIESGDAPYVIAAGKGEVAERIIKESGKNDIPVYEDASLANSLSKLEIGENIPPELYRVVAEVLLFVDKMDRLKEAALEKRNRGH